MVEYTSDVNKLFESLADKTRRDILIRVSEDELTISEIALFYDISFAAVAKHIEILETAGLVIKRKEGKKRYVGLLPGSIDSAKDYLDKFNSSYAHK